MVSLVDRGRARNQEACAGPGAALSVAAAPDRGDSAERRLKGTALLLDEGKRPENVQPRTMMRPAVWIDAMTVM